MCQKQLKISNHSKKNCSQPKYILKNTFNPKNYQTQCKSSFQSQYLHMLFQIVDHPRPLIFF